MAGFQPREEEWTSFIWGENGRKENLLYSCSSPVVVRQQRGKTGKEERYSFVLFIREIWKAFVNLELQIILFITKRLHQKRHEWMHTQESEITKGHIITSSPTPSQALRHIACHYYENYWQQESRRGSLPLCADVRGYEQSWKLLVSKICNPRVIKQSTCCAVIVAWCFERFSFANTQVSCQLRKYNNSTIFTTLLLCNKTNFLLVYKIRRNLLVYAYFFVLGTYK